MFAARARFMVRIGFAAVAGLCLAGCADLARVTSMTSEPLDTNSAVAAQVKAATLSNPARPSFRDVPPKPTDVPAPGAFKTAVAEVVQSRAQLTAGIAANPPMTPADAAQTEAFAAGQRARIPAGELVPPEPVGSEEYAARLRDLATPPPPPK
jgi:hypothetical protein